MMKSNARPEVGWSSEIPVVYLPVSHTLLLEVAGEAGVRVDQSIELELVELVSGKRTAIGQTQRW